MKVFRFVVPAIAGVAVVAAYLGGQYIGAHDEKKLQAIVSERIHAMDSADKLLLFHRVASFLRDSKNAEALLISDQYAQIQVETVSKCLLDAGCATAIGTSALQAELREIVRIRAQQKVKS